MVCPSCAIQMQQKVVSGKPVGVGYSGETDYVTCELKECDGCGKQILEIYRAVEWPIVGDYTMAEFMSLVISDIRKVVNDNASTNKQSDSTE